MQLNSSCATLCKKTVKHFVSDTCRLFFSAGFFPHLVSICRVFQQFFVPGRNHLAIFHRVFTAVVSFLFCISVCLPSTSFFVVFWMFPFSFLGGSASLNPIFLQFPPFFCSSTFRFFPPLWCFYLVDFFPTFFCAFVVRTFHRVFFSSLNGTIPDDLFELSASADSKWTRQLNFLKNKLIKSLASRKDLRNSTFHGNHLLFTCELTCSGRHVTQFNVHQGIVSELMNLIGADLWRCAPLRIIRLTLWAFIVWWPSPPPFAAPFRPTSTDITAGGYTAAAKMSSGAVDFFFWNGRCEWIHLCGSSSGAAQRWQSSVLLSSHRFPDLQLSSL